jgi:predicted RNA polymerase sigma factor
VARALPDQAEAWGLLALLTFLSSRAESRFDDQGRLVLLADQDRSRWDDVAISRADGYLATAAALGHPGRFQLQAAIAGCHANAASWAETDWLQILTLYDLLLHFDSSPVIRLNHAIALSHLRGPEAALAEVDQVADRLSGYHLLHATRAQLLTALGDHAAARVANERALALTNNPAEQQLLRSRLPVSDRKGAGLSAELN